MINVICTLVGYFIGVVLTVFLVFRKNGWMDAVLREIIEKLKTDQKENSTQYSEEEYIPPDGETGEVDLNPCEGCDHLLCDCEGCPVGIKKYNP